MPLRREHGPLVHLVRFDHRLFARLLDEAAAKVKAAEAKARAADEVETKALINEAEISHLTAQVWGKCGRYLHHPLTSKPSLSIIARANFSSIEVLFPSQVAALERQLVEGEAQRQRLSAELSDTAARLSLRLEEQVEEQVEERGVRGLFSVWPSKTQPNKPTASPPRQARADDAASRLSAALASLDAACEAERRAREAEAAAAARAGAAEAAAAAAAAEAARLRSQATVLAERLRAAVAVAAEGAEAIRCEEEAILPRKPRSHPHVSPRAQALRGGRRCHPKGPGAAPRDAAAV